jgi:L-alanine-DL-glutamate epimerase-like enolase superfamily enzyme
MPFWMETTSWWGGALDIALHDLRGKALGKPCFELLGGAQRKAITPYASLQPDIASFQAYCSSLTSWALEAKRRGFRAAKLEATPSGPYVHKGMQISTSQMTEAIAGVRNAVGPDFVLMIDVQYCYPDADTCLAAIQEWGAVQPFLHRNPVAF